MLRFDLADVQRAHDGWGFNCGPGALCAVLDLTPDELRPHLGDFEAKRYTSPSMMAGILHGLKVRFRRLYESQHQLANRPHAGEYPMLGLVRVQWGGPWTAPGVPIPARYRQTHWAAMRRAGSQWDVFDINAIGYGGWISSREWADALVPWLIRVAVPQADGTWWITHSWEIQR